MSREPAYQLYEDSRAHLGLQRLERRPKQLHTDHYRGEVFCATVPNSTLITRRHGRLLISGNSCTIAAAGHMVQSWSLYAERGMQTIPDADILAAYFAISPNDQGAYLLDALNYWRRTGIGPDKIEAYAEAPIGDLAYLKLCIQYFGSAYIGMSLPDENTFGPWLEPTGPPNPYQGHAVNLCGFNDATQRFKVITWGEVWDMSYKWAQRYIDESYACLNDLSLIQASGQSPEGFDWAALQNDLAHIGEVEIRAKFPGQEVQITQFREIEKLKAALAPRAKSRTPWTRLRATPSPERSATSSPGRFDEPSNPGRPP